MELRKLTESNSTITVGWDVVADAQGYRFSREGQDKASHTWDATRTQVRFAKGSAWYRVEALGVLSSGTFPPLEVFPSPTRFPSEAMP